MMGSLEEEFVVFACVLEVFAGAVGAVYSCTEGLACQGCDGRRLEWGPRWRCPECGCCLLYTSDAADDLLCVDLGGRRIIKKKK